MQRVDGLRDVVITRFWISLFAFSNSNLKLRYAISSNFSLFCKIRFLWDCFRNIRFASVLLKFLYREYNVIQNISRTCHVEKMNIAGAKNYIVYANFVNSHYYENLWIQNSNKSSCTVLKYFKIYFSQKQLPHKMKSRLVIIDCAVYIFRQLFLWRLYLSKTRYIINYESPNESLTQLHYDQLPTFSSLVHFTSSVKTRERSFHST